MSTLKDAIKRLASEKPEFRDELEALLQRHRVAGIIEDMLRDVKDPTPEEEYQYGVRIKERAVGHAAYVARQLMKRGVTFDMIEKHLDGVHNPPDNKYVEGLEQTWTLQILGRKSLSKLKKWDAIERDDPERLVIEVVNTPQGRKYEEAYLELVGGGKERIRLSQREQRSIGKMFKAVYDFLTDKQDEYESLIDRRY